METSYFNTTAETDRLKEFTEKSEKQNEKVLRFFKQNPGKRFTPFDVHRAVFQDNTPITSARRVLTVLTNKHLLIRLDIKRLEIYKRPNHVWQLFEVDPHGQTKIF